MYKYFLLVLLSYSSASFGAAPQSTGGAGTVEVTVSDPQQAVVSGATVTISNRVTAYEKSATTDATGTAKFTGVPSNPYHVSISAPDFQTSQKDVEVRSTVPVTLNVTLSIATETTTVEVHSNISDVLENIPTAHTDVDANLIAKLPQQSVGQGLSDALTLAVPGIVQDSNGFFHPLGDHAETQFSVDNQPIADQQNKQATNQLPLNAIQSFEAISGAPPAEFGGKANLVVNTVTKSALGIPRAFGSFSTSYGSFGTYGEEFTLGVGNNRIGNFIAANSSRSGRYLDSPEFSALHDVGNNEVIFDRLDFQASQNDTVHLNLFAARSWFQVPNTYDQQFAGQDQRQQVSSFNIAPGWVHLFGPTLILTVNPYFRHDEVQYFPSANPFADLPATVSQNRSLGDLGIKADVSYVHGIHNAKVGIEAAHHFLTENFNLGITDPAFNSPCLGANGLPFPGTCTLQALANAPNPAFQPALFPFDLTRSGHPLIFRGHADVKEYGFFAQDDVKLGNFTVNLGLRGDLYRGLSSDEAVEPRLGASYLIKRTGTVLRLSYSRFFETPYNENLILSSSTGIGGLSASRIGAFGSQPLTPGRRNQYQTGLQQGIGKFLIVDANYFWKYTNNAFDFDTLFNTPITFPIEWRKSKIDGVSARINLADIHGFTAYSVLGHTRARFFGPEAGGLIFNSPLNFNVFRIDHDQAFEQTTNLRYQYRKNGPWVAFTWRYDSGEVAGSVPDLAAALALTADEQQAIGFFCGATVATLFNPITSCTGQNYGAKRLNIPAAGTENDDTNPPRIAPRHVFDLAVGTDDLFHTDRVRWTLQLSAVNLTNEAALYNFLSTFSGTHFVGPRTYRAEIGVVF